MRILRLHLVEKRPVSDLWDEVAVHYVEMDDFYACGDYYGYLLGEIGEIGA